MYSASGDVLCFTKFPIKTCGVSDDLSGDMLAPSWPNLVPPIMSKITYDLKTIAYTEFCINMLFSYFCVSYSIVKFQTCSSVHG